MEEVKQDTSETAWTPVSRMAKVHKDIVIRIPNFTTIERFLRVGGGNADDIYDRMMERAFPKGSKLALIIMNELQNKAIYNFKAIRTIPGFNGLFGLHDKIFEKKYKGANDLIFWMNGSADLHGIVNLPNTIDKLL